MARKRSPERDKAFQLWNKSGGKMPLKDIAEQLGQPEGTVRGWKAKDCWEQQLNGAGSGTLQIKKRSVPKKQKERSTKRVASVGVIVEEVVDSKLTEKQRLFCLYYVKCFNATQAAIKAGYAKDGAHVEGHRMLKNPKVAAEIRRLKSSLAEDLFIDAQDVLKAYIEIAFSDITDYVSFGQRDVPVMGPFGPIMVKAGPKDESGEKTAVPLMKTVNFVDFNPSSQVDGSIISEVKQGKEGVSIKFADKMKAMEKLEKYFDLLPDKFQRRIEEEKLKLGREKLDIERSKLKVDDSIVALLDTLAEAAGGADKGSEAASVGSEKTVDEEGVITPHADSGRI